MSDPDFDREYNPRLAVANFGDYHKKWSGGSDAVRQRVRFTADIRVDPGEKGTLDLYRLADVAPQAKPRGLLVYVHGGFWRARDKSEFAFLVPPFAAHGYALAISNYDLCPAAPLERLVDQTDAALRWAESNVQAVLGESLPVVAVGHSAGAHLIAAALGRAMAAGRPIGIAAAGLISGVYDLWPVIRASVNVEIGLTLEDAARFSPQSLPLDPAVRYAVVVGAKETRSWIGQSRALAARFVEGAGEASFALLTDHDHFSVLNDLYDSDAPLTRRLAALA